MLPASIHLYLSRATDVLFLQSGGRSPLKVSVLKAMSSRDHQAIQLLGQILPRTAAISVKNTVKFRPQKRALFRICGGE